MRRLALVAAFAILAGASVLAAESAPDADVAAIRHLVDEYLGSVEAADPDLGARVWETTSEVSFIHPLGHEHGWDAIAANVYRGLMGGLFSQRKLTAKDVIVHAYADGAWVEFYWDFSATLRKDGTAIETHGRETQVYRKADGRWRLVHVHYSPLPSSTERRF